MAIAIKFPYLSNHHPEGLIWVHLYGVYYLSKKYARWSISGVHPNGTDTHSTQEGYEKNNEIVEEVLPAFLAAIAAKKEELKQFIIKSGGLDETEANEEALARFGISLRKAKEELADRYQAIKIPQEVFPISSSVYPTIQGDTLCMVKGLWSDNYMPLSLLNQVKDLIDWGDDLKKEDFEPPLVQLLSTGECYGETEHLSLWFSINLEEETIFLYDWKLRETESSRSRNNTLRVCSLYSAPSLYAMYLQGRADEEERWKQRLNGLINN